MSTSRLALLRHLWAMMQTRGEAAGLVLRLQRDALGRGIAWFAVAAMAAMTFMFALVLLVALGTPEEYRVMALSGLALVLLMTAIACVIGARRQLTRDAGLIAEFTTGLRRDLAMVNLALRNAVKDDDEIAEREHATTERGAAPSAEPATSEFVSPPPGVTAPAAMARPSTEERTPHGTS